MAEMHNELSSMYFCGCNGERLSNSGWLTIYSQRHLIQCTKCGFGSAVNSLLEEVTGDTPLEQVRAARTLEESQTIYRRKY